MYALLLAGGQLNLDDPLYQPRGASQKALLSLAGRPMAQWVADAVLACPSVSGLIVLGLPPNTLQPHQKPIYYRPSGANLLDTLMLAAAALTDIDPDYETVLVCNADVPLLQAAMIDRFLALCDKQDAQAYYPLVTEKTMRRRFPMAERTFVRMRGGRYCGGDIFLARQGVLDTLNMDLLGRVTEGRKHFLTIARALGPGFILRFLLGRMDIHEAAHRASSPFGAVGAVVVHPDAEVAMDVDKPAHFLLAQAELGA